MNLQSMIREGLTVSLLERAGNGRWWKAPASPGPRGLAANDIAVWRANLDAPPASVMQALVTMLSRDETERAQRFYFERDRRRFVVARAVLRILLGDYLGCAPHEVAFRYGPQGKPAVGIGPTIGMPFRGVRGRLGEPSLPANEPRLHFNVAHSEDLALIAFTRGCEVGIDVERVRDIPDWESIAELSFAEQAIEHLRTAAPARRREEFFRAWTRQEAVLKALGMGLGVPRAQRITAVGRCARLEALDPAPGFVGALAIAQVEPAREIPIHGMRPMAGKGLTRS